MIEQEFLRIDQRPKNVLISLTLRRHEFNASLASGAFGKMIKAELDLLRRGLAAGDPLINLRQLGFIGAFVIGGEHGGAAFERRNLRGQIADMHGLRTDRLQQRHAFGDQLRAFDESESGKDQPVCGGDTCQA